MKETLFLKRFSLINPKPMTSSKVPEINAETSCSPTKSAFRSRPLPVSLG